MSEEYDLKKSTEQIGQLYPVILDANGEIVDGFHRKDADPNWRTEVNPNLDTREKVLKAKLISNKFRRQVSAKEVEEWINDLAEIALTEHGIEQGKISGWLAEQTGYAQRTIQRYLDIKYKDKLQSERRLGKTDVIEASTSVELEVEEKLGKEKLEQLKEETKQELRKEVEQEIREDIGFKYDIPELLEDPPEDVMDDDELRELGSKIGKDIKEAMYELHDDLKKAQPKMELENVLSNMRWIKRKLDRKTLYNPFDKNAVLVWSTGHTLDETIEEMENQINE